MDFKAGDEVYLEDGRLAEFVAQMPNGDCVVKGAYYEETFDGRKPYISDKVFDVARVFTSAPVKIYDDRVQALKAEASDLRRQVDAAQTALRATEQERQRLIAKLIQVPALKRLEDFIDGKMTHFVIDNLYNTVCITEKSIAFRVGHESDPYTRDLKLLSLFGDSKGALMWRLGHYGSGRKTVDERWIKAYQKLQWELPGFVLERKRKGEIAIARQNVETYIKSLATANATLAALEARQ